MDALEAAANKVWMCLVCGLMYDEAVGWPDDVGKRMTRAQFRP